MNGEYLLKILKSESGKHENISFNFIIGVTINLNEITLSNHFINCIFNGTYLNFIDLLIDNEKDYLHTITFENCSFKLDTLKFEKSHFKNLIFNKTKINANFLILLGNEIDNLKITKSDEFNCPFIIEDTTINRTEISSVKNNRYLKINKSTFNEYTEVSKSNFNKTIILLSNFKDYISFQENNIEDSNIRFNKFEKSNFSNNNFGKKIILYDNEFNGTTLFNKIKNIEETIFEIISCKFLKYTYFNYSELKHLKIDTSKFSEFTSFQETKFNTIFIDRTIFSIPAFFDEIKIIEPQKCSKRTFRIIKQQLLGTHNQIDFNIFKSYELNAYRLELKKSKKIWYNDKDAFILEIGTLFSNNGLNWIKALIVTIVGSLLFYSIFYWVYINKCEFSLLNFENFGHYFNGFSKYIMPTNIYNPFESRKYVTGLAWFPFMLGKFFLAIGVYEIIKSFRKFKK